ncbi:APC family permease [Streptomyces sp. NPDC127084]|uniref:APC family permease n=1 Tax=Streptomyces sp. NPDC127084 TaxID=3347133 RepID=UPI00365EC314
MAPRNHPNRTASSGGDAETAEYPQELRRGLGLWSTFSIGFATISPVVGIYSVVSLGYVTIGPAWVWIIPLVLVLQLSVAYVYAELASQWPLAGGCYQWVRRLVGGRLGWFTGFLYLASAAASLTTVAYLGGPWLFLLVAGRAPNPTEQITCAAVLLVLSLAVNHWGINPLKWFLNAGIIAEAVASVGIGLVLLFFFRNHGFSILFTVAEESTGTVGFLAALAVGGWAFLGFDAATQVAEESTHAERDVPRAILRSLLAVGLVVMLTAFSVTLSLRDVAAAHAGAIADPVSAAIVESFGTWAERPFFAVVLVAFLACAVSVQTYLARAIYGMARDGALPAARALRKLNRNQVPHVALATVTVIASAGLLLGIDGQAAGTLIAFGSGGLYIVFLVVTGSALWARTTGRVRAGGETLQLGRRGLSINILAVVWLVFETVNVAWPRVELAPPGAPWYVVWAVVIVFLVLALVAFVYGIKAKPYLRISAEGEHRRPSVLTGRDQ